MHAVCCSIVAVSGTACVLFLCINPVMHITHAPTNQLTKKPAIHTPHSCTDSLARLVNTYMQEVNYKIIVYCLDDNGFYSQI